MPRRIVVRRSPIHGRGVFALTPIAAGTEIITYRGRLLTHPQADHRYAEAASNHTFLFTLNERYVIDANVDGNSARWINHSCQPNCEAVQVVAADGDPRRDRIVIQALRDIAAGEELTYDYRVDAGERLTPRLRRLWACRCGSRACRGTLLAARRRTRR